MRYLSSVFTAVLDSQTRQRFMTLLTVTIITFLIATNLLTFQERWNKEITCIADTCTRTHRTTHSDVQAHSLRPVRESPVDEKHKSTPSETQSETVSELSDTVESPEITTPLWKQSTGGQYPEIHDGDQVKVDVSISEQKTYISVNGQRVYTMISSTGIDGLGPTPRGTYTISGRGKHFFNTSENMGADYWVSFFGVYLFHSVPTTENFGDYIVEEADKLGQQASHGCVRLSVPDAQWFYENIPDGTQVSITD